MSEIIPNVVVSMPSQLFTLARSFKAAGNGSIYIGKIDTDPLIPANQIQVYVENEDGTFTEVDQPIKINAGGYPVYNGQIAKFVTSESQSMKVLDYFGVQQFYYPNVLKYDPDQLTPRLIKNLEDELSQSGDYATDDTKGDAMIAVRQPDSSSPIRTQHDKNTDYITVMDFGVKGDGIADDTIAFQAAIDWSSSNGKSVKVTDGTFMVSQIVIKPKTRLFGNGRSSVIKRIGLNGLDLIYGVNSNELWGSTDPGVTDFAHDVEIHDLCLDGGVDGAIVPFSSSNAGSAIAIWGHNLRCYNLDIQNFADRGIRTESVDTNVDWASTWQESSFYSIRIRNVGGHGWQFDGPHDSKFVDISIINASQKADNTYDGMITGKQGTGDFSGLHISVSGNNTNNYESLRHRYSLNLTTSCRFSGGTSIEGARIPLRIACSGSQFDSSCTYYAAWGDGYNATAIKMEGTCSLNIIKGTISGSETFRPGINQFGLVFGAGSSDSVNNNIIDMSISGCNIPISFGSSTTSPDGDKGNNTIRIKSYYGGTKTPMGTYGQLNSAGGSTLEFDMSGSSSQLLRSFHQTNSQTLAAGATLAWTFKFPFPSAPIMNVSIVGPSAAPTGSVWVNGISGTSVSIYNGTGTSIIVNATASMSVGT